MHVAIDLGLPPVETGLLVADVPDDLARSLDQVLRDDAGRAAYLACEHDLVRGSQRLQRDPRVGVRAEIKIDDSVGYLIANLIGVPLRHRFAGEEIILARHGPVQSSF